ncbi:MAG: carbohydrate binding family 9 domain-containing protein [Calditrichaeota bacterium]|nr:carbohydrate binding family 9 domain-containing protein [Calditrichota bacterium]
MPFFYLAMMFLLAFGNAQSDPDAPGFSPLLQPELRVPSLEGGIEIDGKLEDPGWQGAAIIDHFSETFPGDQTRPPVAVHGKIAYDPDFLYLCFEMEDPPENIRYSLRDRDEIWQDDYVGILLDTYGDGAWAYFLFANPLGVQGDTRFVTSQGEDDGFDIIYKSRGRLTETGYTVEMAIPFRSLRFPNREEQTWRATFWITHPRDSRRTYSWAAMDRDNPSFLSQFGTLTGIHGIQPSNNFEILPAIVGSQSGALKDDEDPGSGFDNGDPDLDVSLNLKYGLSANMVADLAINPDFSQVEADAAQIDVNSTFALFFPERRPFFQEGSDLLSNWVNIFYSRTINDPLAAGRLTGRFNRTSLAFITARDRNTPIILPFEERSGFVDAGKSYANIFRIKQTFGEDSFYGATLTDRRFDAGGSNTVAGVDLRWQLPGFLKQYRIECNWVFSHTEEQNDTSLTSNLNGESFDNDRYSADFDGESFNGDAGYLSLERDGRTWSSDFDYRQYSPAFRADNGFINRNNYRFFHVYEGLTFRPSLPWIDQISPEVSGGAIWNYDEVRKDQWVIPGLFLRMKRQTNISLSYLYSEELFGGKRFRGIHRGDIELNSNFSKKMQAGVEFDFGTYIARGLDEPVLGDGMEIEFYTTLRPVPQMVIEPQISYARLTNPEANGETIFDGYITRTRFSYQFTRELFLRTIIQYDNFDNRLDIDPLLSYKVNPFTVFYLGSTHDLRDFGRLGGFSQTNRQFFFKFQYLIRA